MAPRAPVRTFGPTETRDGTLFRLKGPRAPDGVQVNGVFVRPVGEDVSKSVRDSWSRWHCLKFAVGDKFEYLETTLTSRARVIRHSSLRGFSQCPGAEDRR